MKTTDKDLASREEQQDWPNGTQVDEQRLVSWAHGGAS
jgi:hypothetical protein